MYVETRKDLMTVFFDFICERMLVARTVLQHHQCENETCHSCARLYAITAHCRNPIVPRPSTRADSVLTVEAHRTRAGETREGEGRERTWHLAQGG